MYRFNTQLRLMDFDPSSFSLAKSNPWVILSGEVPWDDIERKYAASFAKGGKVAINARIAFGALIIKGVYKISAKNLVYEIRENPYLQYFIGMPGFYDQCPFSEYSVARFEKRFDKNEIDAYVKRLLALRSELA